MRSVTRNDLLTMAQTVFQQPEFKIPESCFESVHILTAVSRITLMSFVVIQLLDLRTSGIVPDNLTAEEQKIFGFLLKKSKFPDNIDFLKTFLSRIRDQLTNRTKQLSVEQVPGHYLAKTKLIDLYDYLLRDSLMTHPVCPFFAVKKEIPLQPFESLFGFHFIEIDIKRLVEINDAVSPYFRTLLAIWQKPDALRTPVTVAGLAAQHIDWGGSLSWISLLPTLSYLTPPSVKTFVYKPEYQGLTFSSELQNFLVPEVKLRAEVNQAKKMAAQLLKWHEKLQTGLLKEHGLTRGTTPHEEKDVTLTFAESSISQVDSERKNALTSAVKAMDSALEEYLKIAAQRVSLATLARRMKNWYELTPVVVYSLEDLTIPVSETRSSSTVSSLTESLSQTLVAGENKKIQPPPLTTDTDQSKKSSIPVMSLKSK